MGWGRELEGFAGVCVEAAQDEEGEGDTEEEKVSHGDRRLCLLHGARLRASAQLTPVLWALRKCELLGRRYRLEAEMDWGGRL